MQNISETKRNLYRSANRRQPTLTLRDDPYNGSMIPAIAADCSFIPEVDTMSEFSKYLARERVQVLDVKTKKQAIDGTLELLRDSPNIADFSRVAAATWQREEALATGLGLGIGAPHVRTPAVRFPTAALTVLKRGVEYGSLDNTPVRLVLLVAMPESSKEEWLRYLARASSIFRDDAMRAKLFACTTADQLWDLVKDN